MIETGLSGRVVIVTGAAAGIGKATATAFAKEGGLVALWDVNEKAGTSTADALTARGFNVVFQKVNVGRSATSKLREFHLCYAQRLTPGSKVFSQLNKYGRGCHFYSKSTGSHGFYDTG